VHLPKTKNGDKRDVPLMDSAISLLRLLTRGLPDERVVPIGTEHITANFANATQCAGVGDMHFHDSRHEALTVAAANFPNVLQLAAISGHRDLRSLKKYYNPTIRELRAKMSGL
jgi:integrase